MRDCDSFVSEQAAIYERRRDVLNSIGRDVEKPKASIFVWTRIPDRFREMGAMEFSIRLMEEAEVAVSPGVGFGGEGEGWLRIALVENENRVRQAIRKIRKMSWNGKDNGKTAGA